MDSRDFIEANRRLSSQDLPTVSFFCRIVILYYLLMTGAWVILSSYMPDEPQDDYLFFNISVAVGRFIPLTTLAFVFVSCVKRGPEPKMLRVIRVGCFISIAIYLVKGSWLFARLSQGGVAYTPTDAWIAIELVLYMYLGFLAFLLARQRRVAKIFWLRVDLLMLFSALAVFAGAFLRNYGMDTPTALAAGAVVATMIFGYKLAKLTVDYQVAHREYVTADFDEVTGSEQG